MKINRLFAVLFGLNLLNYIDRQVLYAVFPLIQTDLSLSDLQLGSFASVFICVYLCCAPVIGFFADRSSRAKWIGATACLWSASTLGCGAAFNYVSLLAARAGIGVGEAGFTTIAQPFLAEQYPKHKHSFILALFGLALPLGSALGYILGGLIGQHWGWRAAFMLAGVPGAFLGLYAWTRLKDTRAAAATAAQKPHWNSYRALLKNKAFLWLCLAQAMITFIIGGLSAWAPTYMHRALKLDMAQAGFVMGVLIIVCGALGTFAGGKLAEKLLRRTRLSYFWVLGGALAFVVLPFWAGLCTAHLWSLLACFGLTVFCLFFPTGATSAALVAASPQEVRSMAFALNIFIIHLLGDALSPLFIGYLSDTWSLQVAFWICSLAAFPGAVFAWLAARHFAAQRAI